MNSLLALSGSMVASLLLIAALSPATTNAPPPVTPPPVAVQPAAQSIPASTRHSAATPPSQPQAVIYASNPQNDAQLREWKKRNAESMKILEKTTKEMPLR